MKIVSLKFYIVIFALLTISPGCGGGGGAAPALVLTPPVISGLSFPATVSHSTVPDIIIVDGSVNFADVGGDVVQLDVFVFNSFGTLIASTSTPVLLTTSGVTSGTLGFTVNVETTLPVTYTIQVDVVDSAGLVSNALSAPFAVI